MFLNSVRYLREFLSLVVLLITLQEYIYMYLNISFIFAFSNDSCWEQFEQSLKSDLSLGFKKLHF